MISFSILTILLLTLVKLSASDTDANDMLIAAATSAAGIDFVDDVKIALEEVRLIHNYSFLFYVCSLGVFNIHLNDAKKYI